MLFGAVARPPAYAARLASADLAAIKAMPGVVEVVRDGSFLGVVARRRGQRAGRCQQARQVGQMGVERPAVRRRRRVRLSVQRRTPRRPCCTRSKPGGTRRGEPRGRYHRVSRHMPRSGRAARWPSGGTQAHGVVAHAGPVPASRRPRQGPQGRARDGPRRPRTRGGLLRPQWRRRCRPGRGPARACRAWQPVRVHWAHEEEMAWEPWGSAMITRLSGGIAADGTLTLWTHDVWSFPARRGRAADRAAICAPPGIWPIPCFQPSPLTARCRRVPRRATPCRSTRRSTRP